MRLQELMQKDQETQDDFMNRSRWGCGKKRGQWGEQTDVQVYASQSERQNPASKPVKIMTREEARRYIEQLEPGEETPYMEQQWGKSKGGEK